MRILGAGDQALTEKMAEYQRTMAAEVEAKDERLRKSLLEG